MTLKCSSFALILLNVYITKKSLLKSNISKIKVKLNPVAWIYTIKLKVKPFKSVDNWFNIFTRWRQLAGKWFQDKLCNPGPSRKWSWTRSKGWYLKQSCFVCIRWKCKIVNRLLNIEYATLEGIFIDRKLLNSYFEDKIYQNFPKINNL